MKFALDRHSIMSKILLTMAVVLALQSCFFVVFILFGGTVERLEQNTLDILDERVINRKNYLENEVIQRWSNISESERYINAEINRYLRNHQAAYSDLQPDSELAFELLSQLGEQMVYLLRKNSITGVFLIFQGGDPLAASPQALHKTGLYLRDLDPLATPNDNSDLMIVRGSAGLSAALDITLDSLWRPTFEVTDQTDYYYQPLLVVADYPGVDASDLGFWSLSHRLSENDIPVVTYSQPLISPDGQAYGVLGVELSQDYLRRALPYTELQGENTSSYLLAMTEDAATEELEFRSVVSSGSLVRALYGEREQFHFMADSQYQIHQVTNKNLRNSGAVYGSIQYLTLYNSNTPFQHQRWALIGLVEQNEVFGFTQQLVNNIILFALVSLAFGILVAGMAGYSIARPIQSLAATVRASDPHQPVQLPQIKVREIDELSSSLESLSRDVAEASSKLSQIIELADVPIGAFEISEDSPYVYLTKGFMQLLGQPEQERITRERLEQILADLDQEYQETATPEEATTVYAIPDPQSGDRRWLRLKVVQRGASRLGVFVDVTREMLEKQKIEYERDYDLLTHLLNRRAFLSRLEQLATDPGALKIGALVMMDLDNLKYINDTYGHDYGDEYIRSTAIVLRSFINYGAVVSRMSGDEFYMFFHGYESREALEEVIVLMRKRLSDRTMLLPDGQHFRMRASAGVAWYPTDSDSLQELIRFADFAMYEVKNAVKGSLKNFDIHTYQRDAFLLHSREELNRLIDGELVDYHFQPIVDCASGGIMGYEALMRPRSKALAQPADVLRLAHAQSKLYQIERLTWFKAMETYIAQDNKPEGGLIFINSISNQTLTEEDYLEYQARFGAYLRNHVLELTETDEQNARARAMKHAYCQASGARLAIDDYGSGYNSESLLLSIRPDYVKVDMNLIRNIDQDRNRQELYRNLVRFCHERGIRVLAEGVETEAEMRIVVALGADCLQGYYIGRPNALLARPAPEISAAIRTAYEGREQ